VAAEKMSDFEKLGMQPTYEANQHKIDWFQHMPMAHGFLAQGIKTGEGVSQL